MKVLRLKWTAVLLVLSFKASQAAAFQSKSNQELVDDIVQWVVAQGGFFSSKLEIRGMDPSDPDSPLGVFAKEALQEKEPLLSVPRSAYISIETEATPLDNTEDAAYYYENYCKLANKVKAEMQRNDTSEYAPYLRYLQHQRRGQVPATWSRAGKDVLRQVLPPGHDGVDWIDKRFKKTGCIKDNDEAEEHTIALVNQRGYDQALIPIWDMFNHKNGYVNVENDSIWSPDGFRLRAKRDIEAGEELYATYDKCFDCGNIWWYWGTAEILRDFGFVEDYRRRWIWLDQDIWFEMDYNHQSGELEVIWDLPENYSPDEPPEIWDLDDDEEDADYGVPSTDALSFLRNELERLELVGKTVLQDAGDVPKHEWETILQYYDAATEAIRMAIAAANTYHGLNTSQEL